MKYINGNGDDVGETFEKRPGANLGLKLGLVRIKKNESLDEARVRLESKAGVAYVEPNMMYYASVTPNDPGYAQEWGMEKIKASSAWNVSTGVGSDAGLVCVIDTGVDYTHPDLQNVLYPLQGTTPELRYGYNAITGVSDGKDDQGHGTHCAGVIGATGNNGVGVAGLNWNGRLIFCKFLSSAGSGSLANAVTCVDWCVSKGAKVLSNSWGGGGFTQSLYDAINRALSNNTLFVAAAGNGNIFGIGINLDTSPQYPASYALPNVISVSATDVNDVLASWSNYGTGATTGSAIAAPGVNIYSTLPTYTAGGNFGTNYGLLSGTSMATPHVAGLLGLMRSATGGVLPAYPDLKTHLLNNADVVSGLKTIGSKRLNAFAALNAAIAASGPQPPPPPVRVFCSSHKFILYING